jgi:hypothetical protein
MFDSMTKGQWGPPRRPPGGSNNGGDDGYTHINLD